MIHFDIEEVTAVTEGEGREVIVMTEERLRGPVKITIGEDQARWLYASLADTVTKWRRADGDED